MRFEYEVNNKKEVRVWDTENPNEDNLPFLFQPNWPDETAWASKAEAEAWVKLFIESRENPFSEFLPGVTPSEPKRVRPKSFDPITGEEINPLTGEPILKSNQAQSEPSE